MEKCESEAIKISLEEVKKFKNELVGQFHTLITSHVVNTSEMNDQGYIPLEVIDLFMMYS